MRREVEPKQSNARIRTSNALCGFARAKVAKMSDGKELNRDVMAMICEAKNCNSLVSLGIALAAIRIV